MKSNFVLLLRPSLACFAHFNLSSLNNLQKAPSSSSLSSIIWMQAQANTENEMKEVIWPLICLPRMKKSLFTTFCIMTAIGIFKLCLSSSPRCINNICFYASSAQEASHLFQKGFFPRSSKILNIAKKFTYTTLIFARRAKEEEVLPPKTQFPTRKRKVN